MMKKVLLIIGIVGGCLVFIANIVCACVFSGENGANIFTAFGGWISGFATVILGVVAVMQNKNYKEEDDRYLKEQKDFAWKSNYAEMYKRFGEQLDIHMAEIHNFYPQKLEAVFLENLAQEKSYEYDLITSEYLGVLLHFLVSLRKNRVYNNFHKSLYDALICFNYSICILMSYFDTVLDEKIVFDKKVCSNYVMDASKEYENLIDAYYLYKKRINEIMFTIFDTDISVLKNSDRIQQEKQKIWYEEVKDLAKYTEQLIKKNKEGKKDE